MEMPIPGERFTGELALKDNMLASGTLVQWPAIPRNTGQSRLQLHHYLTGGIVAGIFNGNETSLLIDVASFTGPQFRNNNELNLLWSFDFSLLGSPNKIQKYRIEPSSQVLPPPPPSSKGSQRQWRILHN